MQNQALMEALVKIAEALKAKETQELEKVELDGLHEEERRDSISSMCESALTIANKLSWLQINMNQQEKLTQLKTALNVSYML